jgi:hypothetical protein
LLGNLLTSQQLIGVKPNQQQASIKVLPPMMVDPVKAGVVSPHVPMNASKKQLLQSMNS